MSGTKGTWKPSPPGLRPKIADNQVNPGDKWVLQPVRDAQWWNMADSNAAISATAMHRKPACRHPKGCAGGGLAGGTFKGGPDETHVRVSPEGNLPSVMPQGNLGEILGRDVTCQGNCWWRAPLPARGGHHVKQKRRC